MMSSDRVVARAARLRRLRDTDAGLALLRADLLPVLVAVLAERFTGTRRSWPSAEFLELLSDDLDVLRDAGFDLPRTAQDYLSEWVRQGLLIRRAGEAREEIIEPSPATARALRFAADLESPHSAVTSSRLGNLAELLGRLAIDTDPEQASRLETLQRQRDLLDAEIAAVEAGRYTPLSDDLALEQLTEILHLAAEIPDDFGQVSAALEELNRGLREQIIGQSGSRGDILDEVFAGVDLLENSEAGRTFAAFHSLVLDPEQAVALDQAVDSVLSRDFTAALTRDEVVFLRRLLTTLQRESTSVRQVMTGFSRSLRRFVETHAYREHRRLATALAEAQSAAVAASRVARPFDPSGYVLDSSSVPIRSISSWSLHNPADVRTAQPVTEHVAAPLDLALLRRKVRESEIDFAELRGAVVDVLRRRPVASIADVLSEHPASQGLASVVGLLLLAHSAGSRADGVEDLTWCAVTGAPRSVSVARYVFHDVPDEWRTA